MTVPNTPVIHRHVETPIGIGKSTAHDAHDGDDDELQSFSNWVRQLVCVTTPPDYRGAHESFYLPPWQRRASRWNFSGRVWACLCVEGKYGGCNTRADRITEETFLKGLLYEGVARYGFPAFCPRPLAGQLGLERRQGPSQYTRIGPAHRPARIRAILARRAPQPAQRRQLRAGGDDWARGE